MRAEGSFAHLAVVGQDPHLDQPVGVESGVDFFDDGGREAVASDHHDRVEMMGIGAFFLALGRCELDRGHARIIDSA